MQYTPRRIDIWRSGETFVAKSSSTKGSTMTTTCDSTATNTCSGKSTPTSGYLAFFYVTCGAQTYFGPNPYHFTPSFGSTFPGHGNITNPVRSYVCDNQSTTIRPTWKLMGFFDPDDSECTALAGAAYQEDVCDAPSSSPTAGPSSNPSTSPTTTSLSKSPSSGVSS